MKDEKENTTIVVLDKTIHSPIDKVVLSLSLMIMLKIEW